MERQWLARLRMRPELARPVDDTLDPFHLRLARTLRKAQIAFFEHRPAPNGSDDMRGEWCWSGTHFGIEGVDGAAGREHLLAATLETDRMALDNALTPNAPERSSGTTFGIRTRDGRMLDLCCEAESEAGFGARPGVVFGIIREIGKEQAVETESSHIADRTRRVLAAIDAAPISISVADATQPDMPLIYVNRMFSRLTGYAPGEVMGRNCRFLQGPASDAQMVTGVRQAIASGVQADAQFINYRKDGSAFLNSFILAPVCDAHDSLEAYIAVQTDVTLMTKRRDAEAQQQKMEVLGRMAGGVAHEINNMLQPAMLLGQDLIDRELVAAEGRKHLDVILECIVSARQIVGDLLAFSRPAPVHKKAYDPARLLRDSLPLLRQAVPPSLTLAVNIEGLPPSIAVDRTMFVQIMLNLVSNAAVAMGNKGEIIISLDEATGGALDDAADGPGRLVRLRVTDSGCGMDKMTLGRAFEPFFTTKPIGQGTGLGLAVIHGLIRGAGGTIALDSEPGRGTTATILIPASDGERDHGDYSGC